MFSIVASFVFVFESVVMYIFVFVIESVLIYIFVFGFGFRFQSCDTNITLQVSFVFESVLILHFCFCD